MLEHWSDAFAEPADRKVNLIVMEGDFNPSSDGVNIFIPTDLLLEIKEQGENGKERERLLFSSLAPHLSKIWLKKSSCSTKSTLACGIFL